MFEFCDFLMGEGNSVLIVIPAELPESETFTVSISPDDIRFRADYEQIADIPFKNGEVYRRLSAAPQVGLIEYPRDSEYPDCITAVAYVEVRKAQ